MANAPQNVTATFDAPSSVHATQCAERSVLRTIGGISIVVACASGLFNLLALPLALTLCGAAWLQVLWPATPPAPVAPPSPIATTLSLLATAAALGLAVFLLIAGVITLRETPYSDSSAAASGARLHRWYALLKIPLVLLQTALAV